MPYIFNRRRDDRSPEICKIPPFDRLKAAHNSPRINALEKVQKNEGSARNLSSARSEPPAVRPTSNLPGILKIHHVL